MRQFGAHSFGIDLESGDAHFRVAGGEPLAYAQLPAAVSDAGFELLGLELEVRGRPVLTHLEDGREVEALVIEGSGQRIPLAEADSEQGAAAWEALDPLFDAPGAPVRLRVAPASLRALSDPWLVLEVHGGDGG